MNKLQYNPLPAKPKGAEHFIKGAWRKIGEFGKVYVHTGSRWQLSSSSVQQYNRDVFAKVQGELV